MKLNRSIYMLSKDIIIPFLIDGHVVNAEDATGDETSNAENDGSESDSIDGDTANYKVTEMDVAADTMDQDFAKKRRDRREDVSDNG